MLGQNDYLKDMKISCDDTRDRYVILAFRHPTTFGLSTASSAVSRASHFYCPKNQQFPLSWFQDTMVGQLTLIIIYMYMYLEYPIPVQKNRDNVCANHWIRVKIYFHIDRFIYSEHKQYKTSEYIQYHTHKQQGFTFQLPSQSLVEVWIA